MSVTRSWLDLVDAIGEPAARHLAAGFGGQSITVPRDRSRPLLACLAGMEGDPAGKLVWRFGGCKIYVPSLASVDRDARNARICQRRAAGEPLSAIALDEGLTERMARKIARGR